MKTIEELENKIRVLEIKHEELIRYLEANQAPLFASPHGRGPYEERVNLALQKESLHK